MYQTPLSWLLLNLLLKTQLDPRELVNYRPILNLPFLSKILEKAVSSQLCYSPQKWYLRRFKDHISTKISRKLLSLESQMTCSFHPIVVVALY